MLRPRRRTTIVASAAAFAALFALLGLIPISRLIGIPSFITLREVASPLAGMIFGPATGGLGIALGVFLDFALGRPVVFLGLDFLIDFMAAVTAGLCFIGRRKLAILLPSVLMIIFTFGPAPGTFVQVNGIAVPFLWMHILSVVVLGSALILEGRGKLGRLNPAFVAATMFASTMCGHVTGGILTQFVYLGRGVLFGSPSIAAYWSFVFYVYPAERIFLTVVGTAISLPVLRALSQREVPNTTASG